METIVAALGVDMVDQLRQRRKHETSSAHGAITRIEGEDTFNVLTSAPPPWHSVLLIFTCFVVFIWRLPGIDLIDGIANGATITRSLSGLSTRQIAVIRLVFACVIWGTTVSCLICNGWDVAPPYVQESKLKKSVVLRLKGIKTLWPFTSW